MKKIVGGCVGLVLLLGVVFSCDDETYHTEYERTKAAFLEAIEGKISALQGWRTAVTLRVAVKTNVPTTVSAFWNGSEGMRLCDQQEVQGAGIVSLTVPQGMGKEVLLYATYGTQTFIKNYALTGALTQDILLDLTSGQGEPQQVGLKAAESLYGADILPNVGYTEVNRLGIETVMAYTKEGMDPIEKGLNVNYELISNGPFYITLYYGYTGTYVPRVLGYYRHSKGTYRDLEFVDLLDTHSYDYINGQAKLQYQLDGKDVWYDANFDYRDGYEPPYTTVEGRLNDDAYNIDHVIRRYGDRVSLARGLTYPVNVKPGDRIGFYLKMPSRENAAQRQSIVNLGIPSSVLPTVFYETNWSAKALNVEGKHRSVLIKDHGYTIMGMEDASTTGDFDCNDVLFGLHAEMESEMPTIITPEIDDVTASAEPMVWTVAYEDVAREADFDFNDAVIQLKPNYETEECCVKVMAAGLPERMVLHYNGPEGDQILGELHELLGESAQQRVNTESTIPLTPFVEVDCVKWPKAYLMAEDAKRFYIEVQRGSCTDCSDYIMLADGPGELPQALLVAGEWKWPKEGVPIYAAYTGFPEWAKDATDITHWDWYQNAEKSTCVAY